MVPAFPCTTSTLERTGWSRLYANSAWHTFGSSAGPISR
jgi:hypothetical protein